jgi:hypothetical protein
MIRPERLNRDEEINMFQGIVSRQADFQILLVSAEGGVGKSELMRAFAAYCSQGVCLVKVDFKGGQISLSELLSRLCDSLSWEQCPTFLGTVQQLKPPAPEINVTDNKMFGQNQINIDINQVLNAADEKIREQNRVDLTNALFTDLRKVGQIVFLFDTFNEIDELLKSWLWGAFLVRICHTPNAVVVIAGRNLPDPTFEWEDSCHLLQLTGIAYEHFEKLARSQGIQASDDLLRGLHFAFDGKPLPILNKLQALALQEKAV